MIFNVATPLPLFLPEMQYARPGLQADPVTAGGSRESFLCFVD
ncbi:hypothetical protein [Sphingomonas metalli]|nr:hypothetical protein [Sphingomonas metalli]